MKERGKETLSRKSSSLKKKKSAKESGVESDVMSKYDPSRGTVKRIANPVSKSKISKRVSKDKEIRDLRKIRSTLSKEGLAVNDLSETVKILKKEGTNLADFLTLASKGQEMEKRYGLPYHAIVSDYAEKSELLEKARTKLEALKEEEKEIEKRVQNLKALEGLQANLGEIEAGSLSSYIREYKEFVKLGFDLESMTLIIDELVRQGFDPVESGKIIGTWLTKNRTIAGAILRAEQSLDAIKNEESLTISRIESLVRRGEESQKKIEALESYYTSRSRSLETEYESRQRALNLRMSEERRRAEAETFEILRERDKLRSENRFLKEEEEGMKKELELARSISSLIRNPHSLSTSQLETITLELARVREETITTTKSRSEPKAHERLLEARRQFLLALKETVDT